MKTRMTVRVFDIDWDTDGEKVKLPKRFALELDLCDVEDEIKAGGDVKETIECQIESHIEDEYGVCHNGFDWCFI